MDERADEGRLPWVGEFGARVAQARVAAKMSEAEFTRRVRAYGLDFRQENVRRIESGMQEMTLNEALVFGEVLQIELPTSPGPIKAELANASFARDLGRAQKDWLRIVERIASLQDATNNLIGTSDDLRMTYSADMEAIGTAGDQKLLLLAQALTKKLQSTNKALASLQAELGDPHWSA
jgi:hypothetical protein